MNILILNNQKKRKYQTYCDFSPTFLVDSVHVKLKFWTMTIPVSIVVGQEQKGMYHFMLLGIIVLIQKFEF